MYLWRKLTPSQREQLLALRKAWRRPWHRPPHWGSDIPVSYHVTAACYEHADFIGHSPERIDEMCRTLLAVFDQFKSEVHAWCVLPNHYHALITSDCILEVLAELGRMHGRLSFTWNGEENTRGRQVWCGAVERTMRGDRHFLATMNYVHNNPVRHGYVERWQDWPFGSAVEFLENTPREEVLAMWREYPILDYGEGWD